MKRLRKAKKYAIDSSKNTNSTMKTSTIGVIIATTAFEKKFSKALPLISLQKSNLILVNLLLKVVINY